MTRSTMRTFAVACTTVLAVGLVAASTTMAQALGNPTNPRLIFERTFTSHPFAGAPGNASDLEGLGYVPSDNSLWVADDNGDRIYEIDATTGAYKSRLLATSFQGATQVGTGVLADPTRSDDLESIVYDAGADVLYVTSGNCCNSPTPQPPYHPTVYKLTRQSGRFVPSQWQALPEGQDPTAAGWRPGTGFYYGKSAKIKTYNFATNTIGAEKTLSVSNIVGLTFTDANTAFVTTATVDTSTGRTTRTSDSTVHRFDISGSTWTENLTWRFPLASIGVPGGPVDDDGVIDARDLAIVSSGGVDRFYVTDGYDSRASDDHPIYVYKLNADAPSVSVGDATVAEGASGTRSMRVTVSLSAVTSHDVTVAFGTVPGSATPGSDYTAVSGVLTIPTGAMSTSFSVPVRGDTAVEAKESFGVRLSNPQGATLGRDTGTGRILNDDPSSGLKVAVGDAAVVEGRSGTRSLRFTVSLSSTSAAPVTVSYTTALGTATGSDFVGRSGSITIPAGVTSTSVPISVRGDATAEADETFTVALSNPVGAAIGRTTGVGTILNDD